MSTSAGNVVGWSEAILTESEKVLKAGASEKAEPAEKAEAAEPPTAAESAAAAEAAAAAAQKIAELTKQILEGTDANGDGRITWEAGEGGVAQAKQHVELLIKGEGGTN